METATKDMVKYLNPKAELISKGVFGTPPNLDATLFSALLLTLPGEEIEREQKK